MTVLDAIATILLREGVSFLSCYPTTGLIDATARIGIRPILCRQERVGVGIADGYARTRSGRSPGVFAMQEGPGAENSYAGIATAFSDSVPILAIPLGHPTPTADTFPLFSSAKSFATITKSAEVLSHPSQTVDVMRRAFSQLRSGRFGPVLIEVPLNFCDETIPDQVVFSYRPPHPAISGGDPRVIDVAVSKLLHAKNPIIYAGQGVLYAEASTKLVRLAEWLQIPVFTSLEGKGSFPENHPLSLGSASLVTTGPVVKFLANADLLFAIGTSLTRHNMTIALPPDLAIIHATNDSRDLNKHYPTELPILGDAGLVLDQCLEAAKDLTKQRPADGRRVVAAIQQERDAWLAEWKHLLMADSKPINPYRVIYEFMGTVPPHEAIVTHDSGSPRDQISPFYVATEPHSYLGWGKSHALGSGLGLIIGAKLAAQNKVCAWFLGDAAFGMTGLDIETAVRNSIPIMVIILNNSTMAIETRTLVISHERFRTRDIGGDYSSIAMSLGAVAERVTEPAQLGAAIARARDCTLEGRVAVLEVITNAETRFSHKRAFP